MERVNEFVNRLANRIRKSSYEMEIKMREVIALLNAQLKVVFLIQFVNSITYFCLLNCIFN